MQNSASSSGNKLDDPKIEIVRQCIERAVVEAADGGDLWLTTFLAAEKIVDMVKSS
ncbi:hypothetical protein H1O16_gp340 [Burkholderia phage BcepSaruman]|uniref:Uncharacterized protein n=1 Tax=Burkholderia phage BcepSaruman TaxID=2530032 RepID=A0A4D5ZCJ2_9CAUD|nr:hypothetical protein H1O16_gp340 [Burkholderia phage BcepSaruman]QBX06753.1 hypothetical protein BcepSaruman_340 [Burkholderia phage BcepSaruman]